MTLKVYIILDQSAALYVNLEHLFFLTLLIIEYMY